MTKVENSVLQAALKFAKVMGSQYVLVGYWGGGWVPNRRGYLCLNVTEYRSTMYHYILFTQVWIRMGGYRKCVIPTKPVMNSTKI